MEEEDQQNIQSTVVRNALNTYLVHSETLAIRTAYLYSKHFYQTIKRPSNKKNCAFMPHVHAVSD